MTEFLGSSDSSVKSSSYQHLSSEQDLQEDRDEVHDNGIHMISYRGKRTKGNKKQKGNKKAKVAF